MSTTPPSAARSARRTHAVGSRRASTAAPEELHRSGTTPRAGTPRGRTREEKRPNRFKFLVMRGPPAAPLFASWPWPRHNWMLVGSY